MKEYPTRLGWNPTETVETVNLRAADFPAACVAAREGWGKAWTSVVVTDPDSVKELDVAWRRSDGLLSPHEWVERALSAPREVALVSIPAFLDALRVQVQASTIPPEQRAVWIEIDGMLYAPTGIAINEQFGAIIIRPEISPTGATA